MKAVFKEYVLDYVVYNGHNYDEVKKFVGDVICEQVEYLVGNKILMSLEIEKSKKVYTGDVIIKHPNGSISLMTNSNFNNQCYLVNEDFKFENMESDIEKCVYIDDLITKLGFLKNRPPVSSNNLFTISKEELLKIFDICLSCKKSMDEFLK